MSFHADLDPEHFITDTRTFLCKFLSLPGVAVRGGAARFTRGHCEPAAAAAVCAGGQGDGAAHPPRHPQQRLRAHGPGEGPGGVPQLALQSGSKSFGYFKIQNDPIIMSSRDCFFSCFYFYF
jgi:hypothetical protein